MSSQNSSNRTTISESSNQIETCPNFSHLLTLGSPSKEDQRIKEKFERLLMFMIIFEVIIVSYLIVSGSIGIVSRINLQVSPLPPFAIISFLGFFIIIAAYTAFSLIRKGNVDIMLLGLIGTISILGFANPFIQALNFYLTYLLNDVGKLSKYFLQVKDNYRSYLETIEVERMYLSFRRLLVTSIKKNVLILVLGMMPLIVSTIIEIDIGYRTTLLYPFLLFIILMTFFLTRMGLTKNIIEQLLKPKTQ